MEEHDQKIAADIALISEMELAGSDGLRTLGFEFRFVPDCLCHDGSGSGGGGCSATPPKANANASSFASFVGVSLSDEYRSSSCGDDEQFRCGKKCCTDASGGATRLFYIGTSHSSAENNNNEINFDSSMNSSSNNNNNNSYITTSTSPTMIIITPTNRKRYIADGRHYDQIAQLAQQAAQSLMCTQFNLRWVTVCNDPTLGPNVRAMVDADHPLLLLEDIGNQQRQRRRVVLRELLLGEEGNREEKKDDFEMNTVTNTATSTTTTATTTNNNENNTATNKPKPTLLIATGRGKVRAGIFSRQHLLTSGIEMGTAWHFVHEARIRRGWGVAIIDPNARGEGVGFDTFRRSYGKLFLDGDCFGDGRIVSSSSLGNGLMESGNNGNGMLPEQSVNSLSTSTNDAQSHSSIYILAHSAGGAQLVRHLREDASSLPSIKAIAFTDSSHNVQWCKNNPTLKEFLQTKNCVYVRSNDVRSSQSCVHVSSRGKDIHCSSSGNNSSSSSSTLVCGEEASTDQFWEHRFGTIKTLWAGHSEHSLSNYAGRDIIWGHFDEHAKEEGG